MDAGVGSLDPRPRDGGPLGGLKRRAARGGPGAGWSDPDRTPPPPPPCRRPGESGCNRGPLRRRVLTLTVVDACYSPNCPRLGPAGPRAEARGGGGGPGGPGRGGAGEGPRLMSRRPGGVGGVTASAGGAGRAAPRGARRRRRTSRARWEGDGEGLGVPNPHPRRPDFGPGVGAGRGVAGATRAEVRGGEGGPVRKAGPGGRAAETARGTWG